MPTESDAVEFLCRKPFFVFRFYEQQKKLPKKNNKILEGRGVDYSKKLTLLNKNSPL
jgi:hypothetical protein